MFGLGTKSRGSASVAAQHYVCIFCRCTSRLDDTNMRLERLELQVLTMKLCVRQDVAYPKRPHPRGEMILGVGAVLLGLILLIAICAAECSVTMTVFLVLRTMVRMPTLLQVCRNASFRVRVFCHFGGASSLTHLALICVRLPSITIFDCSPVSPYPIAVLGDTASRDAQASFRCGHCTS